MSRHDRTSFLAQLIWQGDRLGWKEETVLWVLRQGFSHGFPRSDVQAALPEAWRAAAVNIADDQIRDGTPAPRYRIGDRVRIVADRKGRHGSIYDQIWHGKTRRGSTS